MADVPQCRRIKPRNPAQIHSICIAWKLNNATVCGVWTETSCAFSDILKQYCHSPNKPLPGFTATAYVSCFKPVWPHIRQVSLGLTMIHWWCWLCISLMFDALYTPRTPLEAETKQLVVPPGTEAKKNIFPKRNKTPSVLSLHAESNTYLMCLLFKWAYAARGFGIALVTTGANN